MLTFTPVLFSARPALILGAIRDHAPLARPEMDDALSRLADTIYATLYGTLAMAALQGALGGLMFWWLGLPAPLLWGLVMAVLSIIPVFGAFIVWVPAALYLALTGEYGKAAILAGWGAIAIGGIDNLLYPMLVGSRLRLPTVPMFISIIGGLSVFGSSGLVLGPCVVTLTLILLRLWNRQTAGPASAAA